MSAGTALWGSFTTQHAARNTYYSARLEAVGLVVEREGRPVLAVPHLALAADEVLAVIGPNGAGKSTLLQVLGLLLPAARGEIRLDGRLVRGRAATLAARRRMAMVFQEPLLFDATVAANVASGLRLRRVAGGEVRRRVGCWLAALGIERLAERPARALSGGEAQRVSLARALVLDPEVLLLDEPFAALDAATRAGLTDEVERLLRRPGRAVAIVTHDRGEALRLGDRLAVVIDGRIAQLDRPEVVFARPATAAVAACVGVETLLEGMVMAAEDGLLTIACGPLRLQALGALPIGRRVLACLRPETVALGVGEADGQAGGCNHFAGVVVRLRPEEALTRVEVDCGGQRVVALATRSWVAELGLAPGRPVVASVEVSAVHLIEGDA